MSLCAAAALLVLVTACDDGEIQQPPASTAIASTPAASQSDQVELLFAPWRPAPISIEDSNVLDAIAFVCRNPADKDLLAEMADVPIAVADARGDGLVSVILADEHVAFECRLKFEIVAGALTSTILEAPSRLVPEATEPIDAASISVLSHSRVDEESGSRTILFGRVGPQAYRVVAAFNDESEVTASKANGWFYAWWPGATEPGAIVTLDNRSIVQAAADSAATLVEGRVGRAAWWVDPAGPRLTPKTTSIAAIARERECASGKSLEDRLLEPRILIDAKAVLVSLWVRRPPGPQDCQGNPAVPVEIQLPEALGHRRLLDGSEIPPRDAITPVP